MKTADHGAVSVHRKFENLKTEQRPVKTGLNWSFEPQKQAGLMLNICILKLQTIILLEVYEPRKTPGNNWVGWQTWCHMSLPHSLLTTPMKHNQRPPRPSTIGYEDPPPWSRNGDDCPRTSTGAQHHHQRTAMMAHWPRGPTTDWWLPLLWLIYDNCPRAIVINVMGFYERHFIRIAHLFHSFDHWSLS